MANYRFSVIFQNDSANQGSVCLFQVDPDLGPKDARSLAWFARYTFPTTSEIFEWTTEPCFVWSRTGKLADGVRFFANQTWVAEPEKNQVTFNYYGGAYTFENQVLGTDPAVLTILQSHTIPRDMAAVGIGMSRSATFAVQAQPNWPLNFRPKPEYRITFGNFAKGQVLSAAEISSAQVIAFPTNVYSMTATLNLDNSWSIEPTLST